MPSLANEIIVRFYFQFLHCRLAIALGVEWIIYNKTRTATARFRAICEHLLMILIVKFVCCFHSVSCCDGNRSDQAMMASQSQTQRHHAKENA